MDSATLVQSVYKVGYELVERCKVVKQCHYEAASIAVRTLRALGALEEASRVFSGKVGADASLIELKRTLDEADELLKVCMLCLLLLLVEM